MYVIGYFLLASSQLYVYLVCQHLQGLIQLPNNFRDTCANFYAVLQIQTEEMMKTSRSFFLTFSVNIFFHSKIAKFITKRNC